MPNIKSKIKRLKTNEKARLRNKTFRSQLKTALKKAHSGIESKTASVVKDINHVVKLLDKAVAKKVLHKNKTARLKSRLMQQASQASIDLTVPKTTSQATKTKKTVGRQPAPQKKAGRQGKNAK